MKTSKIYLIRLVQWAGDMLNKGIAFLLLPALALSGYYFLAQISEWFKTAEWHWISLHQSLVDFGLIDQYFYFNVPNALGMEKILNGILSLSATFSYFMLFNLLCLLWMVVDFVLSSYCPPIESEEPSTLSKNDPK